jgi:hypothetical protein
MATSPSETANGNGTKPSILIIGGLGMYEYSHHPLQTATSQTSSMLTDPPNLRLHWPPPRPPHPQQQSVLSLPPRRQSPPATRTPSPRTPHLLLASLLHPSRRREPQLPRTNLRSTTRRSGRVHLGVCHQSRRRNGMEPSPRSLRRAHHTAVHHTGQRGSSAKVQSVRRSQHRHRVFA